MIAIHLLCKFRYCHALMETGVLYRIRAYNTTLFAVLCFQSMDLAHIRADYAAQTAERQRLQLHLLQLDAKIALLKAQVIKCSSCKQ